MRILVVEDEPEVRESLRRVLGLEGYAVELAADGETAVTVLRDRSPDAILLDVLLPGIDGLEVCRRVRTAGYDTPVLMLTARDAVGDRVAGLDAGADDYVVKPFAVDEVLARIRALLRRGPSPASRRTILSFSDVTLDTMTREVTRGTRNLELTRTEFTLLELFLLHPRQVLTRSQIFEWVWGYDFGHGSNSLDVYVSYLRKKLEQDGSSRLIRTIRGVGYVLKEP